MNTVLGVVFVVVGVVVYGGQAISVADPTLARRLGLQEKTDGIDPLFGTLEARTARWDLLSMWTLPLAGVLLIADHSWWPYLAMIGGGVWADTGGREIAKYLGMREHDVRIGTTSERRALFGAMSMAMALGVVAIVAGLVEVT